MELNGKIFSGIVLLVLISMSASAFDVPPAKSTDTWIGNDALIPPDVPNGLSGCSPPGYYETSEYLIGDVAVGIIFLESNGTIDPSTEDWTSVRESEVIYEITAGLDWWKSQNRRAGVSFTYDVHYRVPTSYEPIIHEGPFDHDLWISEAMSYLGYPGTFYFTQVRDYVNHLRDTLDTDWSFAVFVVDSRNDEDGCFRGPWLWNYFAYAYLGGPFFVVTYDNNAWGIENMDCVAAHEMGHIFYATDEYDGWPEVSGYLGVRDYEGAECLMNHNSWTLCKNTREQVGWRDSDRDYIQDIVDTFPKTTLNPYSPDPTVDTVLTYTGSVVEIPYPNSNPFGTGRDITINTITNVEYSVDFSDWTSATPSDGAFDEDEEDFTFTTPSLSPGTHIIETRGINSVGNIETAYATDTVTVLGPMERIQLLIETIQTWSLPKGAEDSLTSKLKDALHLLDIGNENGAIHNLMDFMGQAKALQEKKLTNEQAYYLISEAQRIIGFIEL